MLKTAVVAGGATLLASSLMAADEKEPKKDKPKEKKGYKKDDTKGDTEDKCSLVTIGEAVVTVPPTIGQETISNNVSQDKLAVTILFDSLQATYGPEMTGTTFSPLMTAFLEIPVTVGSDPECKLLGYTVDVRGVVDLTKGARASVIVVLGGVVEQFEFPYKTNNESGIADFNKRFFYVAQSAGVPGQTVVRSPLRLQLILSVETASPMDVAVLTVDTVDVEARRAR